MKNLEKLNRKKEPNIRNYIISGGQKKRLYPHKKLHPLTSRKGNTFYKQFMDILKKQL